MASTFSELFSDFLDQVKQYSEKLDVTAMQFMRYYTRGMQIFQRETRYCEAFAILPRNATRSCFNMPGDALTIVEIKDFNGDTLVLQNHTQFTRNAEKDVRGYVETPYDYGLRLDHAPRMVELYAGELRLQDDDPVSDTQLNLWYIPDIHTISQNSPQWNTIPNPPIPGVTSWFPDINFSQLFNITSVNSILAPYEWSFLQFAISEYLKSQGSANFARHFEDFNIEVQKAKANKPVLNHEAVRSYFFAPWS